MQHSIHETNNIDNTINHLDDNANVYTSSFKSKEMDEVKRALVQRYAYDESILFDEEGNEIHNLSDEDDEKFISNRQIAQQLHIEKMQQLRTVHGVNKKEEREKTKLAKLEKNKQKEDRRLRAQKGERRA